MVLVARDRTRVAAARIRRGDEVTVRARRAEVKAVRDRASSGGSLLILVFRAARPVRVRADELVSVDQSRASRRVRAKRSWWR